MKVKSTLKFQMGGQAPMQEPMPSEQAPVEQAPQGAPAESQDPLMQIAEIAAQALQTQDCQAAFAVCEAFLQLIQQAAGGGAAPEQPSEPTFQKRGGKLIRKG